MPHNSPCTPEQDAAEQLPQNNSGEEHARDARRYPMSADRLLHKIKIVRGELEITGEHVQLPHRISEVRERYEGQPDRPEEDETGLYG